VTSPSLPSPPAPPDASGPAAATPEPPGTGLPASRFGPRRALLGIPLLLLIVSVEVAVVSAFDPKLKALGAKLALQALLAVTLAAVAFFVAGDDGRPAPPARLGLRRPARSAFAIALVGLVVYLTFAILYGSFVHPHQKDITRSLGYGRGAGASIAVGILIIGAAPVSEEVFFRGFLFGGLRRRLPFVAAAVVSAAVFGAFHYTGSGSLTVLPQLAALGLVQAWIYERSGSIVPTIALHMLNNALAFALITS
jgi:membrane protease YdiL (CAAX protease family)